MKAPEIWGRIEFFYELLLSDVEQHPHKISGSGISPFELNIDIYRQYLHLETYILAS
jgi:hypothetical protein